MSNTVNYTLGTSAALLFTVEANSSYAILSATLNNLNSGTTTRTATLYVDPGGTNGGAVAANEIVTAFAVQKGRQPSCALQGKTLQPGTAVYGKADVAAEVVLTVSSTKQPYP